MDKIIEGLLNIELEALEVLQEAEIAKNNLPKEILKLEKEIAQRSEVVTKTMIKELYAKSYKETEAQIEINKHETAKNLEFLQHLFDENHSKWETDMFFKICENDNV